ncbi:putative intracellular protease/amidase [Chitinophaga niastensis]|uniref:Putative intracellular protease/amidase n=1 Tax=Chitinophaga niastensis TaxID=536980 RepID=A0A2P8HH74_CHINA|nr:type 1 glutamine amidotransferase domain-containing protein [Chitinophaga niastensis]PSL45565.1 putative intracellular protease/amidase [Chitinophaga niastensis]
MKYILFIVTSVDRIGTDHIPTGYEFSEIADPYWEFTKAGFTVDFASPTGGSPPEDGYEENNTNSRLFRNGPGFKRLNFSHKLENVDIDAYDGIFFPGGLGPMVDMVDHPLVKDIVSKAYEKGKIVAAVCHGPVALLNVKLSSGQYLVEGKKLTSFTTEEEVIKKHHVNRIIPFMLEEALIRQGGIFNKKAPFISHIIKDGLIITGQNPASAKDVAQAVIEKILGQKIG